MTALLSAGFADTFRQLYPDKTGAYTWWSYRRNARANNAGWRIDYFIVSRRLLPRVASADIYAEIPGSDHCPVALSAAWGNESGSAGRFHGADRKSAPAPSRNIDAPLSPL